MPTAPNTRKMNTYRGRDYTPEVLKALSCLPIRLAQHPFPVDRPLSKKEAQKYGKMIRGAMRAEMKIQGVPEPLAKKLTRPTK